MDSKLLQKNKSSQTAVFILPLTGTNVWLKIEHKFEIKTDNGK